MRSRLIALLLAFASPACSTRSAGDTSADATVEAPLADAGVSDATAPDAPITDAAALPQDVPDVAFNYDDCTNLDFDQHDETAPDASRLILFSFHANTQQYAPRCMRIKAGQSVTWEGDFADHPLVGAGGDLPNPIDVAAIATGTEGTIAFPDGGWYGFECQVHESPAEYGAILVMP